MNMEIYHKNPIMFCLLLSSNWNILTYIMVLSLRSINLDMENEIIIEGDNVLMRIIDSAVNPTRMRKELLAPKP